jgi:hypothetical protein
VWGLFFLWDTDTVLHIHAPGNQRGAISGPEILPTSVAQHPPQPLEEELGLSLAVSQLCASVNHLCSGCVTSGLSLVDS